DEVKIFRGNVEAHLRRLEGVSHLTGNAPPPLASEVSPPRPPDSSLRLDYGRRQWTQPLRQHAVETLQWLSDTLGLLLLVVSISVLTLCYVIVKWLDDLFWLLCGGFVAVCFVGLVVYGVFRTHSIR